MDAVKDYIVTEEMYHSPRLVLCRGMHQPSSQKVLLTILTSSRSTSTEKAFFRHELSRIQALAGDGILKIIDVIDTHDKIYIIRENFDGNFLNQDIRKTGPPLERLLALAIQLSTVIDELHVNDIIHRRIRPTSFFVSPDLMNVKLVNFGVEDLIAHEQDEIYHPVILRHMLPYIAPEQTGRMNRSIDHRTDLYSLGTLLYELFAGRTLFASNNPLELFHAHMAIRPPSLSTDSAALPRILSEIIAKLLAKEPSDRYQSCFGLKRDLEECLNRLHSEGDGEKFLPGLHDRALKFNIPQKIYGRENETDQLVAAYNRVSRGAVELFLITGEAGVGKSVLVHEISSFVHSRGGYFTSGKFDPIKAHKPYQAFIHAFQILVRRILAESEEHLSVFTKAFKRAVGPNGKIITDVIPEFEIIIGKQPELHSVDQEEADNRFRQVFQNVCRVFQDETHPLFFFLDDLQWADTDSLNLLSMFLHKQSARNLLVVAAFREEETTEDTPLSSWRIHLPALGLPVHSMELTPMSSESTAQLLSDTFQCRPLAVQHLAEIIHSKTSGNPFFLKQFLINLHEEKLIRYNRDAETRPREASEYKWLWDSAKIEQMRITDNVVDFVLGRMNKLDTNALGILETAACIGQRFNLETLSVACGQSPDVLIEALNDPVEKRILLTTEGNYAFIHERIREAAMSLLTEAEKKQIHYKIGAFLIQQKDRPSSPDTFYAIADHLSLCNDLIVDADMRKTLIGYNLKAARTAKQTSAYKSALEYFQQAAKLLPARAWRTDYPIAFEAHIGMAECLYLSGNFMEAEALFDTILKNTTQKIDKAEVYSLMALLLTNQNRYAEAIRSVLQALDLFDSHPPEFPSRLSVIRAFLSTRNHLRKVGLDSILSLPEASDPEKLAVMDLLARIIQPAYFSSDRRHRNLMALATFKILRLSLRHGHMKNSPYIYLSYATILAGRAGDYKNAYTIGKVGVKLNEKMDNHQFMAKVYVIFAGMVNHWCRSTDISVSYLEKAIGCGIESGDLLFTANALTQLIYIQARSGKAIDAVLQTIAQYKEILMNSKHVEAIDTVESFYRMLQLYQGQTKGPGTYDGDDFSENDFVERIKTKQRLLYNYHRTKVESLYVFGFFTEALGHADTIIPDVEEVLFAVINTPETYFYSALTIAALYPSFAAGSRKKYGKQLKTILKKFKKWADTGPDNYQNQYSLLQAEYMRIQGHGLDAVEWYQRAMNQAHEKGRLNHEAIACECAARFYQSIGDKPAAALYLNQAYTCYQSWGASAKCEQIKQSETFQTARLQALPAPRPVGDLLDLDSIFRFTEVISSEIYLNRLIEKLIKVVLENAGASRGLLFLPNEKELVLEAEAYGEREEIVLHESVPIAHVPDLPHAIVNYAGRTAQTIVIDNAAQDNRFADDEYIRKHPVLSVLCLPIVKQKELKGLFYLENEFMTAAFSKDRIKIVQLLSTHAATALENALLFEKKHHAEMAISTQYQEIQRQYEEMESINQALRETQAELLEANQNLSIFKTFAEETGQGFGMADMQGNLTYINRSLCRLTGHDQPEQAYGRKISEYHPPEIVKKLEEKILPAVLGQGQWIGESTIVSRTGVKTPIIQNIFLIRDQDQKPMQLASVMIDITDRKKAEKALNESEARYRMLVDTMNEGLCLLDSGGTIIFTNKALSALLQHPAGEMTGRPFSDFLDPANRIIFKDQFELEKTGVCSQYELEILRKDGGKIQMSVSPQPVYNEAGEFSGSLGILTDITHRKRMEADLLKASKLESLGIFAGGIAHDFNNLLTAILGKVSISKLKLTEKSELFHILTDAEKASIRAKNLAHQLLTFSKGGAPLKKVISVTDILKETVDFVLSGSNVSCEFHLDEAIANIEADPGQISQVINNLVINARQAMPNGGVVRIYADNADRKMLPLSTPAATDYIRIRIVDQGGGIPAQDLDKIFDPYFTTKVSGTGLGLSISYSIIKKHAGYIFAASESGQGSTFDIFLPSTTKLPSMEKTEKALHPAAAGRILVMDDDETILEVIGEMLEILGHTVHTARDGEEALDKYNRAVTDGHPYDLLIMDLTIPGKMGGKDALALIRKTHPAVKAVVSSGYSNDPIMSDYQAYGFTAVLAKPYLFEEVKKVADSLLAPERMPG